MESIFAPAYYTIAATSANDCDEGLLDPQPGGECVWSTDSLSNNFDRDVEKGILNKRACVLQEQALSRRIIHFTAGHTYWECGSVIRSECFVDLYRLVLFAWRYEAFLIIQVRHL